MKRILAFLRDTDGPTAVEYAVMLGLVLAAVIVGIQSVGGGTGNMYINIDGQMGAAGM